MGDYCRLCKVPYTNRCSYQLFGECKGNTINLAGRIVTLGINIYKIDDISSTICKCCFRNITKVENALRILETWKENQLSLGGKRIINDEQTTTETPTKNKNNFNILKRMLSPSSAHTPTKGQRKKRKTPNFKSEINMEDYVVIDTADLVSNGFLFRTPEILHWGPKFHRN